MRFFKFLLYIVASVVVVYVTYIGLVILTGYLALKALGG